MPTPKPTEIKRQIGNPGKRKLPNIEDVATLPMVEGVPEPPQVFHPEGQDLWRRVWTVAKTWISPDTDMEVVVAACRMQGVVKENYDRYNETLLGKDLNNYLATQAQMLRYLQALGFTPLERSKMGVAEVKKPDGQKGIDAMRNQLGGAA